MTTVAKSPGKKKARPRRNAKQIADRAEHQLRAVKARYAKQVFLAQRELTKRKTALLSVHSAAEQNRFTNDWFAPGTSADSENLADLHVITARARQLIRDDATAKSIVRSFKRNVVGTGIDPTIDDRKYAKAWKKWARSKLKVDREGRMNLRSIARWAVSELVGPGECFVVRWVVRDRFGSRLELQRFESEQLDRYKIEEASTNNEVRGGIEVDQQGKPVAYHFYYRHPHDVRGLNRPTPLMMRSMRVPAKMVSHIYDPERVRQTRGVSRLASVMRKIRDLAEYDAAQLRVARAEASIGLLVKGTPMDENGVATDPLELDGLNIAYLADDEDVTPFVPSRPGRDYEPFVKIQLHGIAAGVGMSYEQLARDLKGTSFSGGRQGAIDDRREWLPLQDLIVEELLQPVFEDWLFIWAMQNQTQAGDYFLDPEAHVPSWQGQGWDWVDPEAQGKSIERKYSLGLTNRTIECALLGTTPQQIDKDAANDGTREVVERLSRTRDARENPAPDGSPTPEQLSRGIHAANTN